MARDDDHHFDDLTEELPPREVTLSTSTILGIFFALALVCAAFFGFGYTVGRKSVSLTADPSPNAPATDSYKPPAGSPAIQPVPGYLSSQQAADANKSGSDNQVYAPPSSSTPTSTAANTSAPTRSVASSASPTPAPARAVLVTTAVNNPPPQQPAPAAQIQPAASSSYVQIAAFSRQDDADLVLNALRSRGYAVNAQTAADHLIHLQMGPYPTHKDAEAMRQRLIADGYNAIVK